MRTESNGLNLPVVSAGVNFLSVESKVDGASVSGPDDNFFPASDLALAASGQKFGRDSFAVGSDRGPGFFARLNDDRKLALSCGGGGSRCVVGCFRYEGRGRHSGRRTSCGRASCRQIRTGYLARDLRRDCGWSRTIGLSRVLPTAVTPERQCQGDYQQSSGKHAPGYLARRGVGASVQAADLIFIFILAG